jgi:hypothetical protein
MRWSGLPIWSFGQGPIGSRLGLETGLSVHVGPPAHRADVEAILGLSQARRTCPRGVQTLSWTANYASIGDERARACKC